MSHHSGAKQTIYSLFIMLSISTGLYFGFKPSIGNIAYGDLNNYIVEEALPFRLPEIGMKENISIREGNGDEEIAEKYGEFIKKPQNLPLYYVSMVVDGGTIIVDGSTRLRLAGIKAPDKDEEFGMEATDFLKSMIEGKDVEFQIDNLNPKDDFGRLRGVIYLNNVNMNIEMVRAGIAHVFPISPSIVGPDDWINFEKEAQEARRGLWGGEKYYNQFFIEKEEIPEL